MKYIYHSAIRESLGGGLCVPVSGTGRGVLLQPQPLQGGSWLHSQTHKSIKIDNGVQESEKMGRTTPTGGS